MPTTQPALHPVGHKHNKVSPAPLDDKTQTHVLSFTQPLSSNKTTLDSLPTSPKPVESQIVDSKFAKMGSQKSIRTLFTEEERLEVVNRLQDMKKGEKGLVKQNARWVDRYKCALLEF